MALMSAEAVYTIIIRQGATYLRTIAWKDAAGTLVDTDTYTATLAVYPIVDGVIDDTAVLTIGTATGEIETGISGDSNVRLTIAAADTAALTDWGKAVYTLNITDGAGRVTRLMGGHAYLSVQQGA